ncbi:uncharacterized protein LOC144368520 [Ictidomys tridecemlineatus]
MQNQVIPVHTQKGMCACKHALSAVHTPLPLECVFSSLGDKGNVASWCAAESQCFDIDLPQCGKLLPKVEGVPRCGGCEGIVVFKGVTPKGATGCAAKPANVLREGLGGRAKAAIGRLGESGPVILEMGGWLWEETAELTHTGVWATMVVLLGGWGKVWLKPTDARGLAPPGGEETPPWACGALAQLFPMAWVSPIRRPLMRCRAFFFSLSRSSAVTAQVSNRGGGSFRGSPRRHCRRGNLRFRGLLVFPVGPQQSLNRPVPEVVAASEVPLGSIAGEETCISVAYQCLLWKIEEETETQRIHPANIWQKESSKSRLHDANGSN